MGSGRPGPSGWRKSCCESNPAPRCCCRLAPLASGGTPVPPTFPSLLSPQSRARPRPAPGRTCGLMASPPRRSPSRMSVPALYTTTSGRCSCRAFSRFLSTFCRYSSSSVPHSSSTFRLMASGGGDSDAPACSRETGLGHCLLPRLTLVLLSRSPTQKKADRAQGPWMEHCLGLRDPHRAPGLTAPMSSLKRHRHPTRPRVQSQSARDEIQFGIGSLGPQSG